MNASEYKAVGFNGNVFCVDCLPYGVDVQGEEVAPIFADSSWDVYPVCCECGIEYDYVVLLED